MLGTRHTALKFVKNNSILLLTLCRAQNNTQAQSIFAFRNQSDRKYDEVDALQTQLAGDICVELKNLTCFDGAEGVSEHLQR